MICDGLSDWDFSADKLWPWKEAEYLPLCWLLRTTETVKVLFVPGPSAAPRRGHLKQLSELWWLRGLLGQRAPTASCRVWLVSTLADLSFSRSPPHLLVLYAHSEVMERRFSRKDLGSWQGRVRTSLLCSTTPSRTSLVSLLVVPP